MKKILSLVAVITVIGSAVLFTTGNDGHASSNGAPSYSTGSPGDGGNCTDCHSGTAASGGTITSNIPASGYVAGTTYNFTVSISGSSSNNYGFEVACENTAGAFLGTLSAPGTGAKLITTSHFVTHSTPGTGTSKSWTFSWTAPATSTPTTVTFYAAFLVGNNNGSTSGDATKNTTKTYTLSSGTPCAMTSTITSQTNVSCNAGTNGAATIAAGGGTGTLTYSWVPSGGTSATASGLSAGAYTCTVKDANNCATSKTITITQPTAITATSSQTNTTCNAGTNGAASVAATGGTGTLTYSWTPSGGTAATAAGLAAGNYTCTIKDANSCTSTKTFTITQPGAITATPSQTNISCNGLSNGAASIAASGGTGAFTYSWTPSGGTSAAATGLAAGNYTCTIKDANNCSKTQSITITQPTAVTTTVSSKTNVGCNGGANGSASIGATGGTSPYTYNWSPAGGTASTASGLTAGSYTCTVTDAHGCAQTQSVTFTQPTAIVSSISSQTNITSCTVTNNGAASISASGGTSPYSYNWAPSGGTASTATGLSAGTYTCTITDANSCTKTQTVTITQPSNNITSSIASQTNVSCNGLSNATASVSASGGTGALSYSWTPAGGTSAAATGLSAGTYTCTIKDANNCSKTQVVTITQPTALASIPSQTNITCANPTGQAQVAVTGGTSPYAYNWTPSGGSASTASGLSASNYTCTITDANSCTKTQTFSISSSTAAPVVSISSSNSICNGQSVSLTATGATTYSWNTGATTASISVSPSATTSYSVAGSNGCVGYAVKTITVNPLPTITAVSSNTMICAGQSATLTAGGASTYTWNTSATGANLVVNPTTTTSYTVIGTSAANCSNYTTVTQSVSVCTGIDALQAQATSMRVYPNPNHGSFTLEVSETSHVWITTIFGEILMDTSFEAGSHALQLENLSNGIYFIHTLGQHGTQYQVKMIKE